MSLLYGTYVADQPRALKDKVKLVLKVDLSGGKLQRFGDQTIRGEEWLKDQRHVRLHLQGRRQLLHLWVENFVFPAKNLEFNTPRFRKENL